MGILLVCVFGHGLKMWTIVKLFNIWSVLMCWQMTIDLPQCLSLELHLRTLALYTYNSYSDQLTTLWDSRYKLFFLLCVGVLIFVLHNSKAIQDLWLFLCHICTCIAYTFKKLTRFSFSPLSLHSHVSVTGTCELFFITVA